MKLPPYFVDACVRVIIIMTTPPPCPPYYCQYINGVSVYVGEKPIREMGWVDGSAGGQTAQKKKKERLHRSVVVVLN